MGKWRDAFEHGRPSFFDIEFGLEYSFGPPATEEQLAFAEKELGMPLPADVREFLSEFNGIRASSAVDREQGDQPTIAYLDVEFMAVHVSRHLRTCDNELPSESELRKVVFVYQENGLAGLYGVCTDNFGEFRAGEVVKLDHDVGEFEKAFPNLLEFVRLGCRNWD